jgi:DNA polymerase-3 subunit delta'
MGTTKVSNMTFTAIPGHESIKMRLCYITLHNQVPHAQLFWGAAGSAQLSLALAFATYLHCTNQLSNDACQQCSSCLKMQKLVHPDLKFVFPTSNTTKPTNQEAGSNNYLQAWRSFVQEQPDGTLSQWSYRIGSEQKQLTIPREEARQIAQYMSIKPLESKYKIILIWLPEYLHPNAANALLKTLEEPSLQTIFLLVSIRPEKIIHTIKSRTQPIYVPPFSDHILLKLLTQQYDLPTEQLQEIVPLANGNIHQARELLENKQKNLWMQFATWMRLCYKQDLAALATQADTFQQLDKEAQKSFLVYALHVFRETLVIDLGKSQLLKSTYEEQEFLSKFKRTLKYEQIKYFTRLINQAYYHLERNVNSKMLWLNLSIKIALAFKS